MRDAFVPYAQWLASSAAVESPEFAGEPLPPPCLDEAEDDDVERALADARYFRAALADALEIAVRRTLEAIADDVLGRELQLAPVDIDAIVRRALHETDARSIVAVRVHPDESIELDGLRVFRDASLRRGDVAFDVTYGAIDASLAVRRERVIDACTK